MKDSLILITALLLGGLFALSVPAPTFADEPEGSSMNWQNTPNTQKTQSIEHPVTIETNTPHAPTEAEMREIKKNTPPSLAHKIARGVLIGPLEWIGGIPITAAYIARAETVQRPENWGKQERRHGFWAVSSAILHLPESIIDGCARAPVYSGAHAWGQRPLLKKEI